MEAENTHHNLAKDFDKAAENANTGKGGIPSVQGVNLSDLTLPSPTVGNNAIPGLAMTTPTTAQSALGALAQESTMPTSTHGLVMVTIMEQMLAMLNYVTMQQVAGTQLPLVPSVVPGGKKVTNNKRAVSAPAQEKGRGFRDTETQNKLMGKAYMAKEKGKNKRKFISSSVQIEDGSGSSDSSTEQRSKTAPKDNKLKDKVSFLKSQLKSLELELQGKENKAAQCDDSDSDYDEQSWKDEERAPPKKNLRRYEGSSATRGMGY